MIVIARSPVIRRGKLRDEAITFFHFVAKMDCCAIARNDESGENLPKKLYIKTYGCQMNVYDTTRIADVMAPLGYGVVDTPDDADIIMFNTCHIREKAAEKMYSDLGRARIEKLAQAERGKRMLIAVAGCVAQAEGEEIIARAPYVDMVVGPQSYHTLPALMAQVEATKQSVVNLEFVEEQKFDLLPESLQPQGVSAFVSIQEGCDKFCTFCVVPYTRGSEFSRPLDAILREVRTHIEQGALEITLLGQNVNAYHGRVEAGANVASFAQTEPSTPHSPPEGESNRHFSDSVGGDQRSEVRGQKSEVIGQKSESPHQNVQERFGSPSRGEQAAQLVTSEINLAQLLHAIAKLGGLKRLRYTTSHPRDMTDDLIRAHGEIEVLMPMLHLPVQSGSDKILKAMNRKHTAADYISTIEKLRAVRPDMAFSSDFIVGFPGETDADFEDTLKLVETVGFASSYVFKYSPRPGTPAADKAEQVQAEVMDERMQRLMKTISAQQLRFNQSKLHTTQPVLMDRLGKKPGQVIGKTPWMQSVVLENAVDRMGSLVDVAIAEAYELSLKGEVIGLQRQKPS